jgi:hypothetical protein
LGQDLLETGRRWKEVEGEMKRCLEWTLALDI